MPIVAETIALITSDVGSANYTNAWAAIEAKVEAVRSSPSLLGYYICDDCDNAASFPPLQMAQFYQALKGLDPFHVVLGAPWATPWALFTYGESAGALSLDYAQGLCECACSERGRMWRKDAVTYACPSRPTRPPLQWKTTYRSRRSTPKTTASELGCSSSPLLTPRRATPSRAPMAHTPISQLRGHRSWRRLSLGSALCSSVVRTCNPLRVCAVHVPRCCKALAVRLAEALGGTGT